MFSFLRQLDKRFVLSLGFLVLSAFIQSENEAKSEPCTVCLCDVSDEELIELSAIQCKSGHSIHKECVVKQLESLEEAAPIEAAGLKCCGSNCEERLQFSMLHSFLSSSDFNRLQCRIQKEKAQSSVDVLPIEEDQALYRAFEEAFLLRCPSSRCRAVLSNIEGCNAAICSNPNCKRNFCFLCLKSFLNKKETHNHVYTHSWDFYERRLGYTDRYHWQLARRNLHHLFLEKDHHALSRVTEAHKKMLEERKMWPMPAGDTTENWISKVKSLGLSEFQQIELFQNESIFLRSQKEFRNADQLDAEIRVLGGQVLTTLDRTESPHLSNGNTNNEGQILENQRNGIAIGIEQGRIHAGPIPIQEGDPRVPTRFWEIKPRNQNQAQIFRIGNFIVSDTAEETLYQPNAKKFCNDRGGRLPDYQEWREIIRAHHRFRLPNMGNRWFWIDNKYDITYPYAAGPIIYQSFTWFWWMSVRCVVDVN